MVLDIEEIFGQLEFPIKVDIAADSTIKINDTKMIQVVRREVRPIQATNLISNYEPHDMPMIVIAHYITPKAKKTLKEAGINYIDSFGNAYIFSGNTNLYIEKNNALPPKNEYSDLFTVSGGQVIFQLLIQPDRVKCTYREISDYSTVSLGTVSKTINSLKNEGYIHLNYENEPELTNREKLLEKWVVIFNEKVLPAMRIGTYSFIGPGAFEKLDTEMDTKWGGESGAAALTQYLSPQKFTVYTNRNPRNFHKEFKVFPNDRGEVTVYQTFWKQGSIPENYPDYNITAHPLLIYSELIYSDSERNKETAQLIFNDYIKPKL